MPNPREITEASRPPRKLRRWWPRGVLVTAGLILLFVLVQGFVWHALSRGGLALAGNAEAQGRFAGSMASNAAIFGHMVSGGLITMLAILQWSGALRRRWPGIHRLNGRVLAVLAALTGFCGLSYIAFRGTIGGAPMSIGFSLYGGLMVLSAGLAPYFAIRRQFDRHRRWAVRLIILCLASWLYRVHYGVLYGISCSFGPETCGIWTEPDFSGPFDRIQNFAFFIPYLLLAEIFLRRSQSVSPLRASP